MDIRLVPLSNNRTAKRLRDTVNPRKGMGPRKAMLASKVAVATSVFRASAL
jgi:hypothetical protein